MVYSVLLGCLSWVAYSLDPTLARPTVVAGLAGGVLCLAWSFRVVAGHGGKALPLLTLIPVTFVLLSQVVTGWLAGGEPFQGRQAAASVITLAFVLSVAMLARIAYAGVVFDTPAPKQSKKSF